MGRFATTAALYEAYRPPYSAEFFHAVAQKLALSGRQALIDLGTGPGLLALGFAPYAGRVVGVDPEPNMLAAARAAAARAGADVTFVEGRAEDLPDTVGGFDVVTIGRALHWMDHSALEALFARLVARDGAIVVCTASSVRDGRNPWLEDYNAARRNWSDAGLLQDADKGARTHRNLAEVLGPARFGVAETVSVETTHEVHATDLAWRVLTFSSSSPAALGDKVDAMLADMQARLRPFSRDGVLTETVVATADIARRL
ncbi:MAG: class I SAM-dependent methyltransferase [Bradyrhizobium sp.]|nr:class I SAM-dependent methyltransferase [Bradyrhizobium sp.]